MASTKVARSIAMGRDIVRCAGTLRPHQPADERAAKVATVAYYFSLPVEDVAAFDTKTLAVLHRRATRPIDPDEELF
jgi:hypothetical protein